MIELDGLIERGMQLLDMTGYCRTACLCCRILTEGICVNNDLLAMCSSSSSSSSSLFVFLLYIGLREVISVTTCSRHDGDTE